VIGSLEGADAFVRRIAEATGCVAASVDYRLAPEHRYPAAIDDCFAATQWVAGNAAGLGADPTRLVVAGDSAGGKLAGVVAIRARDARGPAITVQYLICPVTDHDFTRRSYIDNADGYLMTKRDMEWFWGHYAPQSSAAPRRARRRCGFPRSGVCRQRSSSRQIWALFGMRVRSTRGGSPRRGRLALAQDPVLAEIASR
jgi:acetyl esterase